ncbi:MAG: hypothetical protein EXS05_03695 [Planctomycetaceae bacterium]|nr:hypothetical protein [Planctomycetaceae bacterium]
MQNHTIAIVSWGLRLLRICGKQIGALLVLPTTVHHPLGLGSMVMSVDLDSSRLDAVSRSVLWGAGVLSPEPVPAAVRLPATEAHRRAMPTARQFRRRLDC